MVNVLKISSVNVVLPHKRRTTPILRIADNGNCIVVRRKNVGYLLICSLSASGKPVMRAIIALPIPSTA
jgi:hypothetical protein